MSVPVNERSTSKLEVCIKAHDLCCYTLQITKNKKVFTEEYQSALTDKIIQLALDIHTECWGANNIMVTQESDFEMRTMMQTNALVKCNELLSLIEVATINMEDKLETIVGFDGVTMQAKAIVTIY